MSIAKIFKKRKQASDDLNVILKIENNLSDEQKNDIISIVKNGVMSGIDPSNIAINIMMSTGIYDVIILNRINNGMEVII